MWALGVLLSVLLVAPWVSADLVLETPHNVDAGALTNALLEQVGTVEGIAVDTESQPGQRLITIRKRQGEFTSTEQAKLQQVVSQHDAVAVQQARVEARREALKRLKAKGYTEADLADLRLLLRGD